MLIIPYIDHSFGLTAYDRIIEPDKDELTSIRTRGFKLTRDDRNQAHGYVEDFVNCGSLIGFPYVEAFVVGDSFSEKITPISTVLNENNVEVGKVRITTFSQLVDTAERRLFGLDKN